MVENSIWPVVIGGALAVAGGAITSGIALFSRFLESRTEKKKRRADKFENLVELIYEFDHWLASVRDIEAFGDPGKIELSPLAKIEAIAAVHFPKFNDGVAKLSRTAIDHSVWIYSAKGKRLAMRLDLRDGFEDSYRPYNAARTALLSEMKEFAQREFR